MPKVDTGAVLAQLRVVPMDDAALALLARIKGDKAARVPTIDDLLAFKYRDDALVADVRRAAAAAVRELARALDDDGRPWGEPQLLTHTVNGAPTVNAAIGRDPTEDLLRLMTPGGQAAAWAVLIERGTPAAMSELHELWRQCPADRLPPHPCGPFVAAWQKHAPVEVEAETRADAGERRASAAAPGGRLPDPRGERDSKLQS